MDGGEMEALPEVGEVETPDLDSSENYWFSLSLPQ